MWVCMYSMGMCVCESRRLETDTLLNRSHPTQCKWCEAMKRIYTYILLLQNVSLLAAFHRPGACLQKKLWIT